MRQLLETEQKALEINLDPTIYGTFAEIGAGQEVARYFFQVGAAAGTIAKTMSAYDKTYSDEIYGPEPSGRYVCESRIYKMLGHEFDLMDKRLRNERPACNFFVFADTVAAINFQRTIKGNGWLGIRFQLQPGGRPNDLVIHAQMLDNDNQLQQQAIGILGVNLIYACFRYAKDPETLLQSLLDGLQGRVQIDMVRLTGPDFLQVDNRILSLYLVKNQLSNVAMFGPNGQNIHPSEFLYKKQLLIVRGSFRPPTLVNLDMIQSAQRQFLQEPEADPKRCTVLTEITLDNLQKNGPIDERDFLDRAELLNALGQTVMISNFNTHQQVSAYFSTFRTDTIALVLGVQTLLEYITHTFENNQQGHLLAAFGVLFSKNLKIFVYPALLEGSGELMTAKNMPIPEGAKFLVQHLQKNRQIIDIEYFDKNILHIFSKQVLSLIRAGRTDWTPMVPPQTARLIKEKFFFGYPCEQMNFEY
jgi:hypothetical protein